MSAAYPTPSAGYSAVRLRPPSAQGAETLVLVGLILQVIGGVIVLAGIVWFFGFSVLFPYPWAWAAVAAAVGVGILVVVFLYYAYTLSYLRIQRGEYSAALGPTLVLGILSLFVGLLPGILYLVGYVKLGDAIREQAGSAPASGGYAAAPLGTGQIACRNCGRVHPFGAYAYCPVCGQKLGP